ncbi:hypothetical protein LGK95_06930 [Clostridium algoriphilum]|uniref:hypothetical protein n=1 Tax=Clostridium algoriphilum TaxID=198347 RepID=UPI001CF4C427|nr:hypothetical protein [Clostridium algoriphilum]MCB2293251.1 hypothetical protein [Clostridium algoriphilum]
MDNNNQVQTNNNNIQNGDINNQAMTLKDWIITYLLLLIPIANIVLMFVWAFGQDVNQSKKTFFQAQLIILAVVLVLYILFFGAIIGAMMGTGSY